MAPELKENDRHMVMTNVHSEYKPPMKHPAEKS